MASRWEREQLQRAAFEQRQREANAAVEWLLKNGQVEINGLLGVYRLEDYDGLFWQQGIKGAFGEVN